MEMGIVHREHVQYMYTSKKPSTIYTCKNGNSLSIIIIRGSGEDTEFVFEKYKKQNTYKPFAMLLELKDSVDKRKTFETNEHLSFFNFIKNFKSGYKAEIEELDDLSQEEEYLSQEQDDLSQEEEYLFQEDEDNLSQEEEYLFQEVGGSDEVEDNDLSQEVVISNIKTDLSIEEFFNNNIETGDICSSVTKPPKDIVYYSFDSNNNILDSILTRIDLYDRHCPFYKIFYDEDSIITTLDISKHNDYFIFHSIIEKYTF